MSESDQHEPEATVLKLRSDSAIWREVGGEVIVFGVQRAEYLATNPSGASLWSMLAEGATLDALAATLARQWGLSAEQSRIDAEAFVSELRAQGMIEG